MEQQNAVKSSKLEETREYVTVDPSSSMHHVGSRVESHTGCYAYYLFQFFPTLSSMHSSPFSVAGMAASTSGHHHQFHGSNLGTWGTTSTGGQLASSFSDTLSQSRSQYQSGYLMVRLDVNVTLIMSNVFHSKSSQSNVCICYCSIRDKDNNELKFDCMALELTTRKSASR